MKKSTRKIFLNVSMLIMIVLSFFTKTGIIALMQSGLGYYYGFPIRCVYEDSFVFQISPWYAILNIIFYLLLSAGLNYMLIVKEKYILLYNMLYLSIILTMGGSILLPWNYYNNIRLWLYIELFVLVIYLIRDILYSINIRRSASK